MPVVCFGKVRFESIEQICKLVTVVCHQLRCVVSQSKEDILQLFSILCGGIR